MPSSSRYQPGKGYQEIRYNPNKKLLSAELNEQQDIARDFRRNITKAAFGQGNQYQDGWRVIENPSDTNNKIMINPGYLFVDAFRVWLDAPLIEDTPAAPLLGTRVDYVWVLFSRVIVDGIDDSNIVDPGLGATSDRVLLYPQIIIKEGDSTPPTITQPDSQWLVLLATLTRPNSPTSVLQSMITDARRLWFDTYVEQGLDIIYNPTANPLDPYYTSGRVITSSSRHQISSGQVSTLSTNTTTYMYVDSTGSIHFASPSMPDDTANGQFLPLYRFVTNASRITRFDDIREFVGGNPLVLEELFNARAQFNSLNERLESPSGFPWMSDPTSGALYSAPYGSDPTGYGYQPSGYFANLDERLTVAEWEIVNARYSGPSGGIPLYGNFYDLDSRIENIEVEVVSAHFSEASGSPSAYFADLDARFENIESELVAAHSAEAFAALTWTTSPIASTGFSRLDPRVDQIEDYLVPMFKSNVKETSGSVLDTANGEFANPDARMEELEAEVIVARGVTPSLNGRLSAYIDPDGDIPQISDAFTSTAYASGFVSLDQRMEYTETDVTSSHFGINSGASNTRLRKYLGAAGVSTFNSTTGVSINIDSGNWSGIDLGTYGSFSVSAPSSASQVWDISYDDITSGGRLVGFIVYNSGSNNWSNFRWHFFASYD